jgi:hypothetical protein
MTTKILAMTGLGVVMLFAAYGALTGVSDVLDESHGRALVEMGEHPFVKGATSALEEKFRKRLQETPDEELEQNSELMARKLYPVAKGALKGTLDAVIADSNRTEVPKKMYEAGRNVTENVVRPFSRGMLDGTTGVLDDVDVTLDRVREFTRKNQDIIDAVAGGISAVGGAIKERAPTASPFPGDGWNSATPGPLPAFPPPPPPIPGLPTLPGHNRSAALPEWSTDY